MDSPNDVSGNQFTPEEASLSTSDVERLLTEVARQEKRPVPAEDDAPPLRATRGTRLHDFRRPAFVSGSELRKLKLRHEEFTRSLASRLSIFLRLEFTIQLLQLETKSYEKFIESLANPTLLTVFKLEPLRGLCLFEIHPRLGMNVVDRLMGGAAKTAGHRTELSEIERALFEQTVQLFLTEWSQHWSAQQKIQPVLLGHENNGRFLQIASADTPMLVLSMEGHFGDSTEQIQMAFPCHTLEPLVASLRQQLEPAVPEQPSPGPGPLKWNKRFDDVHVRLTAQWPRIELSARQVAHLKIGDVLPLDPGSAQEVEIRLAGLPKFTARLGSCGQSWAVEVTQLSPLTSAD